MRSTMGTGALRVGALLLTLLLSVPAARADETAGDGETVEKIIGILKQKGLIDDEEQDRLLMKHAAERRSAPPVEAGASILDGFDFYGDFRLRYELFAYRDDPTGTDTPNRYRFRYRGRLGFEKELADSLKLGMRFVTGGTPSESETRSTNQTLGREANFDYDSVRIDRAYVSWKLAGMDGLQATLIGGKIANPFVWKTGKDIMMFDHDVTPEGGAIELAWPLDERTRLFGNVGAFVVDENSSSADPMLFATQVGGTSKLGPVDMGLRGSLYWWRALDDSFIEDSEQYGNLPTGFPGSNARIGSVTAFLGTDLAEDWPAVVYGMYAKNFQAQSGYCTVYESAAPDSEIQPIDCSGPAFVPPAGSVVLGAGSVGNENDAWSAGLEVGSAKIAKLGFAYFHVEANAVMALFTDSDVLDGVTNRQGWILYGARKLLPNVELDFAYYMSTYIDNDGALYLSLVDSKRARLQTDLVFKF